MALVAAPSQGGLIFRINPDGTLVPIASDSGIAALGTGNIVVTNLGGDARLPTGAIPLPFSRYVCDSQKFRAAGGRGMVFDTF
jgi:hypothetical protein